MSTRTRPTDTTAGWFATAIATLPDHRDFEVAGRRIHVRTWGDPTRPPLVLVHGGGAHSGWWDHIAPHLADTHYVIAPDLSGHGDSDARESYDVSAWAGEVITVALALGDARQLEVIGHSLGGWVAAAAARLFADLVDSVLIVDSPPWNEIPEDERIQNRDHVRYSSRADIVKRFAPFPPQRGMLDYVAAHIADQSVKEVDGQWIWKFDPTAFGDHLRDPMPATYFDRLKPMSARLSDRMGYVRCERGVVTADMAARLRADLGMRGPYVELLEAGHHPMLDQPLPLIAVFRAVLDNWTDPQRTSQKYTTQVNATRIGDPHA